MVWLVNMDNRGSSFSYVIAHCIGKQELLTLATRQLNAEKKGERQRSLAFTKSIAYKLSRDLSFSSFPGA